MPTAKKTPQDHKPKTTETKTVTVQNIEITIDPSVLDDMRLLHLMNKAQKGDAMAMDDVTATILADQYDTVLDALTDEKTRRVSTETFAAFISELFEKLAPNS